MMSEKSKIEIWKEIVEQVQQDEKINQRLPGEISVEEFLVMSDAHVTRENMARKLNRLVRQGKLSHRIIIEGGRKLALYRPTDE